MQASALVNNTVSSILLSLFFPNTATWKKTKDLLFHPPCIISRKDEWQLYISCSRKGAIRGGVINYSLFMYVYVKFGEFNSGVWPYVDLFMRLFSCWIKHSWKVGVFLHFKVLGKKSSFSLSNGGWCSVGEWNAIRSRVTPVIIFLTRCLLPQRPNRKLDNYHLCWIVILEVHFVYITL